jgi:hypothetical protein
VAAVCSFIDAVKSPSPSPLPSQFWLSWKVYLVPVFDCWSRMNSLSSWALMNNHKQCGLFGNAPQHPPPPCSGNTGNHWIRTYRKKCLTVCPSLKEKLSLAQVSCISGCNSSHYPRTVSVYWRQHFSSNGNHG